jgi:hypothetical protein
VKIETWATNQRGTEVMPGTAIIRLPHRAAELDNDAPDLPVEDTLNDAEAAQ